MQELRPAQISPTNLLLDPNNFRFQDSGSFQVVNERRFHEDTVQSSTFRRLVENEKLSELKRSILRNGFIPVERIVVRPYPYSDDTYVVIEGNRRVAAIKGILGDHAAGIDISPSVLQSIHEVPVLIAEEDGVDEAFRASLMGIRHVSGIKEWGGYQRASLIVQMHDELDLDPQDVAERLALTTHEVNRRYRAFKALQQLQEDEEFGEYASSDMYPIFHEAISLPIVREWLNWDEGESKFRNQENTRIFYDLITPATDDNDDKVEPKITSYAHVRELRHILAARDAVRILVDPHRSFQEAVAAAHQKELLKAWRDEVEAARSALDNMAVEQLRALNVEELELLEGLQDLIGRRLRDHRLLISDQNGNS